MESNMDLEKDSVNISIDVDPSKTNKIGQLCQKLSDTQKKIQGLEEETKELKKLERELSEISIPEAMEEAGMEDFKCSEEYGGARVKVTDFITARIKASNLEEGLTWLRDNGAGHMIKNTVSVDFDTNEDIEAQNLVEDLQQRNMDCKQKQGVNTQTLSAYVREEFRNGRSVDLDLLGVYQCKKTKLILSEK
tara:strand:+ start:1808 stop:2383 length:576 start_codon:yes stop_codon:yes gene_type:complete